MSVTTIPLQLLDCFRVRVSLESSTTSDFSWNVQTLDRRSTEDSETTIADPYITVDLIRTGTLNSIQIRTSLPPPRSPSTSSLSVSNDGSRSSPSNGLGNVATSSTHDSRNEQIGLHACNPFNGSHQDSTVSFMGLENLDGLAHNTPHDPGFMSFYDMSGIDVSSQMAFQSLTSEALQPFTPSLSHSGSPSQPALTDSTSASPSLAMTSTATIPSSDGQSWGLNSISPTPHPALDQRTLGTESSHTSDEWLSFPIPQLGSPSSVTCPPSPSPSVHSVAPSDDSSTSSSPNVNQTGRKRRLPCLDSSCTRRFANEYTRKVHMGSHLPKKRYLCREGCSAEFSRLHDRLRHEAGKHNQLTEWFCFTCLRPFSSKKSLKRHACAGNVLSSMAASDNHRLSQQPQRPKE
ncbi:uncharacterized protein STEHIDRAFT_165604 [Stereum hirsutum FP-91666 SS1]|uniref:uncharacterized protein n=1 Tax=Stereum hirsutum (strain FP-91666) TaxID=721885 RepID=UPI000440E30B|nr:uncharacterized protein STEHIDRAFT_165604 [Stereum hirsutum FP-91666 SS1]EIM91250.1 hypothetical protein STEHIDRAFT_165604 [Stereum hirsutum FP-91666 SS1]